MPSVPDTHGSTSWAASVTLREVTGVPAEIIPAPQHVIGTGHTRRARPPLSTVARPWPPSTDSSAARALPEQEALAGGGARRKRKEQACKVVSALECDRPQLDSCAGSPVRVGRCRCQGPGDTVVAVPLPPQVLCSGLTDDMHELVVVEMRAPLGDCCWLEDERVTHVHVECGSAAHILSRELVRAFVTQRVPFSQPTRNLARSIYKLCAPLEDPSCQLLVSLVPAADLVAACTPPSAPDDPTGDGGTSVSP